MPEAFAGKRGGGHDVTPFIITLGVVAIIVWTLFMLGSSARSSLPQKETPKTQDKNDSRSEQYKDFNKNLNLSQLSEKDSATEQESLEQKSIDDVTSLSFRF